MACRSMQPRGSSPVEAHAGPVLPGTSWATFRTHRPDAGEQNEGMPTNDMALGGFLRAARERVSPDRAGLDVDMFRRRVPGLRREELAHLAGVSIDYYTRLEQGRSPAASHAVLEAISDALRLDPTERAHLQTLAEARPRASARRTRQQKVDPQTYVLLDVLQAAGSPAFVLGRRLDVLAHNRLAGALITDFNHLAPAERNQARFVFLDAHARQLYTDWNDVAQDTAAMLRVDAGRHPDDPALTALVGDLSIRSAEFRTHWARNAVHTRTTGRKRYSHPLVGDLTISYQAWHATADPEQTLFVYQPADQAAADALRLLEPSAYVGTALDTRQRR